MSEIATGSCTCQSVQYSVKEELKSIVNCHCNTCKKMTGSAFSVVTLIQEQNLEITKGQDKIATYSISENATKHFCSVCGSPIYNEHKAYPGHCLLPAGTLNDPSVITPAMNIFCESMLSWVKNISELKSFDQLPQK